MRARKAMDLGTVDIPSAGSFICGFNVGCSACGREVPTESRERATIARGWRFTTLGPEEMAARGLNKEEIVDELLAIEIEAWEACESMGNG